MPCSLWSSKYVEVPVTWPSMSWRCVGLPISFRLSSRSSAKMSLRNSSMTCPLGALAVAGGGQDGVDDRLVAGAAADVSRNRVDHVGAGRRRVAVEQRLRGHHHAGRAEAALRGEVLHERGLDRVQARAAFQPVRGLDRAARDG